MEVFKRFLAYLAKRKWLVATGLVLLAAALVTVSQARTPGPGRKPTVTTRGGVAGTACVPLLAPETPPIGTGYEFTKTDFSRHCVRYSEILTGQTKDGIPAIDTPHFVDVGEGDAFIKPVEPVIALQVGDDVRAYPIQIMIWHEIVNDTVGGVPVAITFCPLCGTGIVFERAVGGRVLDFGVTGRLRFANEIMYDRQTESWWQQETGQAIIGALTGLQLTYRPAETLSWAEFKAAHPHGHVMSRNTGYSRPYGRNPYADQGPGFLYQGPPPPASLPQGEHVLAIVMNGEAIAYPYSVLQRVHMVNDTVGGTPIVVFWTPGTSSQLDIGGVANEHDVGSATMFLRTLNGQTLTFTFGGAQFTDTQTSSLWTHLGQAASGKLAGQALTSVAAFNSFWFSWAAFQPNTRVYHQ
jgi:hypothetical protein